MEDNITFGSQEIKLIDRSIISINGVNKIISFDDEEFLMETNLGNMQILGESLELLKLDTKAGDVKIKGQINALNYIDGKKINNKENIIAKLFK